jgi:HEAT repeat protein
MTCLPVALLLAGACLPAAAARRYRLENVLRVGQMHRYDATMVETQASAVGDRSTTLTLRREGTVTHLPVKPGVGDEVICGLLEQWKQPTVQQYLVDGRPAPAGGRIRLDPPLVQLISDTQSRRGKPKEIKALSTALAVFKMIPWDAAVWPATAKAAGDTWERRVVWGQVRGRYTYTVEGLEAVDGVECLKTVVRFSGEVRGANPEDFHLETAVVTFWTHPAQYVLHRRLADMKARLTRDAGKRKVTMHHVVDWKLAETKRLGADDVAAAAGVLEGIWERAHEPDSLRTYLQRVLRQQPDSIWQPYAEHVVHPPEGSEVVHAPPRQDPDLQDDPRLKIGAQKLAALLDELKQRWLTTARAGQAAKAKQIAMAIGKLAQANRKPLVAFIGSKTELEREAAALGLAAGWKDVPEGYAALVTDAGKEVRRNVALGIGIRPTPRPMPDLLAVLIGDKSSSVRHTALWAAWRTTQRGSAAAARLMPLAIQKLSDHRPSVREQAARCLGVFGSGPSARQALEAQKKTEQAAAVLAAINGALAKLK